MFSHFNFFTLYLFGMSGYMNFFLARFCPSHNILLLCGSNFQSLKIRTTDLIAKGFWNIKLSTQNLSATLKIIR